VRRGRRALHEGSAIPVPPGAAPGPNSSPRRDAPGRRRPRAPPAAAPPASLGRPRAAARPASPGRARARAAAPADPRRPRAPPRPRGRRGCRADSAPPAPGASLNMSMALPPAATTARYLATKLHAPRRVTATAPSSGRDSGPHASSGSAATSRTGCEPLAEGIEPNAPMTPYSVSVKLPSCASSCSSAWRRRRRAARGSVGARGDLGARGRPATAAARREGRAVRPPARDAPRARQRGREPGRHRPPGAARARTRRRPSARGASRPARRQCSAAPKSHQAPSHHGAQADVLRSSEGAGEHEQEKGREHRCPAPGPEAHPAPNHAVACGCAVLAARVQSVGARALSLDVRVNDGRCSKVAVLGEGSGGPARRARRSRVPPRAAGVQGA
jgi:hypothetical protein